MFDRMHAYLVPGLGGLALPALFAIGTALPLLPFAAFLAFGLGASRQWIQRVRNWDRYVRLVAGLVFLLAGLNDTILYWFLWRESRVRVAWSLPGWQHQSIHAAIRPGRPRSP